MKRSALLTVIFLVLSGMAYSQGGFLRFLGNVGTAVGAGIVDKGLRDWGFTQQESHKLISDISDIMGLDSHNVNRGMEYVDADKKARYNMMTDDALDAIGDLTGTSKITSVVKKGVDGGFDVSNAEDKYETANIITRTTLDMAGDITNKHEVTDRISTFVNNELTYQSDISRAETVEDLQNAIVKKKEADEKLFYDVGMAVYDRMEEKKKSPKKSILVEPIFDGPLPAPNTTPITDTELESVGTAFNVVEEQEVSETSEYKETVAAFNANQKELEVAVDKEKNDVVSSVPQESESITEDVKLDILMTEPSNGLINNVVSSILESDVLISQPSEDRAMNSKRGMMKEDNKQEIEDSQKITENIKPTTREEEIKPEENNILEDIEGLSFLKNIRTKEIRPEGDDGYTYIGKFVGQGNTREALKSVDHESDSDVPQESQSEIEILKPDVISRSSEDVFLPIKRQILLEPDVISKSLGVVPLPMIEQQILLKPDEVSQPSEEGTVKPQESIMKEESKLEIEESSDNNFISKDSPKITAIQEPKKQKGEYPYDITPYEISQKVEDPKPAEKNITDASLVPIVKECGVSGYPFNSTDLNQESKKELDELYDILTKNVDLHIKITGHTCNVGTASANFRVGFERAKKWRDYLVEKGIDTDRILLDSKGATQPIVANTSNENRETNRRIEIDVLMSVEEEENTRTQVNRLVQLYASRTFRVQIMAAFTPVKNYDSVFIMGYDIYDPIEEEIGYVQGKMVYRYVSEEMHSKEDAKALRDDVAKRGFKDAWIVEYKGGVRGPF